MASTKKIKLMSMILCGVLALSAFSGCDTGKTQSANSDAKGSDTSETNKHTDITDITEENSEPVELTGEFRDITAFELVSQMNIGWNLGNSLDATGNDETSWGNPVITPTFIQAVKDAGFNTIRIPITWYKHMGEAPDYAIEDEWLDRVQEVVDYAMGIGMYTIINVHHDGGDAWLTPAPADEAEKNAMTEKYTKLWEQISSRFQDYNERLVFESMNEFHEGYGTPQQSWLDLTNELNQTFIDTIRISGGNNDKRVVLLPGYNTNIEHTVNHFVMPTDTVKDKVIISVHYYDPYLFALESKFTKWGKYAEDSKDSWGDEAYVDSSFDKLKKAYIDNNIPVIIGEMGATAGVDQVYRVYYEEYIVKAARDRDIVCIIWDNGSDKPDRENFGLFNRFSETLTYKDLVAAVMEAASGKDYEVKLRDVEIVTKNPLF